MTEKQELESILVKLPTFIKRYYVDTAGKYGQSTAPYAAMILINHALENGAEDDKIEN